MFLFKRRAEAPLIKITARTAAEIAAKFKPQPAAQALLVPTQTPSEYLQLLEQNKHPLDALNLLAHGLPDREAVWWACQSALHVAETLNSAERSAFVAAQAWARNPTSENKAAAAAAAAKTEMKGPGGWAAQAAAWSQTPGPTTAASASPAPPLTGPAVSGAILLAAGLAGKPPMPEVQPRKPEMPAPAAPKLSAPNTPSLAAPNLQTPAADAPKISLQIPSPSPAVPSLQTPTVSAPAIAMPKVATPTLATPAVPGAVAPSTALPSQPAIPQTQIPKLDKPAIDMPKAQPSAAAPKPELPPLDEKKLAKMLQPFINIGKDVAAGKNTWS